MNDKVLAHIVAFIAFAACCVGVPLLLVFLSGSALFAWLGDAPLWLILVVVFGVAIYALIRRTRKRAAARGGGPARDRFPSKTWAAAGRIHSIRASSNLSPDEGTRDRR